MFPVVPKVKGIVHVCSNEKKLIDECSPLWDSGEHRMKLDEEIKTRVPKPMKQALQQLADERHLTPADLAREAFRQYIKRQGAGRKKAVVA